MPRRRAAGTPRGSGRPGHHHLPRARGSFARLPNLPRRADRDADRRGWLARGGHHVVENEAFRRSRSGTRRGARQPVDKRTGKELSAGEVGNELLAYGEYPTHPYYGEGPWHLTPTASHQGTRHHRWRSLSRRRHRRTDHCEGPFELVRRSQETRLWNGLDRIELTTSLHDSGGHDLLFRVRFPVAVEGARRSPGWQCGGRPDIRVTQRRCRRGPLHPRLSRLRLVRPGATARVAIGEGGAASSERPRVSRAIGVAEVVVPGDPGPGSGRSRPGRRPRPAGRDVDPVAGRRRPLWGDPHRLEPPRRPDRVGGPGDEPIRGRRPRRGRPRLPRRARPTAVATRARPGVWVPEDGDRARTCGADPGPARPARPAGPHRRR